MLYRTNLVAMVAGGRKPKFADNTVAAKKKHNISQGQTLKTSTEDGEEERDQHLSSGGEAGVRGGGCEPFCLNNHNLRTSNKFLHHRLS